MLLDIDISMRVFNEKFRHQMFINKGITITTQGAHTSFIRIFFLFSLGEEL